MKKRMKVKADRTKRGEIRTKTRETARATKAGDVAAIHKAVASAFPASDEKPAHRRAPFFTDAKGIRHPIYFGVDLAREVDEQIQGEQTGYGDYPRPEPTSSVKCGECRHAEECGALKVCRSFLSPRAGFMHVAKHACGYGRAHEAAA